MNDYETNTSKFYTFYSQIHCMFCNIKIIIKEISVQISKIVQNKHPDVILGFIKGWVKCTSEQNDKIRFNSATSFSMFLAMTWICNVIRRGLFVFNDLM